MPDNKNIEKDLNKLTNSPKGSGFGRPVGANDAPNFTEAGKSFGDIGYGTSKYDAYLTPLDIETKSDAELQDYLNENRFENQGAGDMLYNAIGNFSTSVGETIAYPVAGLIDIIGNTINYAAGNTENINVAGDATKYVYELGKELRSGVPIYHSKHEKDMGAFEELYKSQGTVWADQFSNGLGTTVTPFSMKLFHASVCAGVSCTLNVACGCSSISNILLSNSL